MGLGFTLVVWGIIFSILAFILGLLAAVGVRIFCKPKGRILKMVLAFLTPGVAIFVYAGCSMLYMALVSSVLNIDLGFGDSWYVPIDKVYALESIDTSEHGMLMKGNEVMVEHVTAVQVIEGKVVGKGTHIYFALDMNTGQVRYYPSLKALQKATGIGRFELMDNATFYWKKRETVYMIGGILCLIIMLLAVKMFWKVGLYREYENGK